MWGFSDSLVHLYIITADSPTSSPLSFSSAGPQATPGLYRKGANTQRCHFEHLTRLLQQGKLFSSVINSLSVAPPW